MGSGRQPPAFCSLPPLLAICSSGPGPHQRLTLSAGKPKFDDFSPQPAHLVGRPQPSATPRRRGARRRGVGRRQPSHLLLVTSVAPACTFAQPTHLGSAVVTGVLQHTPTPPRPLLAANPWSGAERTEGGGARTREQYESRPPDYHSFHSEVEHYA